MFSPIVILIRRFLGKKRFNHVRAEVIKLHSSVITHVSGWLGFNRQKQMDLIHLARENGRKLGLLA